MHAKLSFAIFFALLGSNASQAAAPAGNDIWQYEVTPYLFAAGMDGKIGLRGVTTKVDTSFNDIVSHLDSGFMGLFTARKGPWSYSLEAVYMKLSGEGDKSVSGPFGRVNAEGALSVTSKLYVYQGSVGYRVLDNTTAVDLVGALRYTRLSTSASVTMTTTPGIVFPGGTKSASGSQGWTDAVVGVRVVHPLTDQLSLFGYADVGGGGSDLTYQFMLGANWKFAKNLTAKIGYRQLYWDYKKDGTVWNMTASGPYLGLGISF